MTALTLRLTWIRTVIGGRTAPQWETNHMTKEAADVMLKAVERRAIEIVALPAATPVTPPADETVATPLALEVHVTTRSVTTAPFASLTVAARIVV